MDQPQIGFIGLGKMGLPMAANLLKAGYGVTGFDVSANAGATLGTEARFTRAASATAAAQSANIVILMLPDSKIVDRLLWDDGLANALQSGALLIDMGSSDPIKSKVNAEKLAALGIRFVDGPVSGGVKRAVDGSLTIMIGGETAVVEAARPVLAAIGNSIVHVGASGAGHAVKALNNYVSAAGLLAVCEALTAAQKFGIDPKIVNQVLNTSSGRNNTTDVKVENFMLSGKFNSGFAISLMRKDLETAESFINAVHTPGDFAHATVAGWREAEQALEAGADHTAMYSHIQEKNQTKKNT